MEIALSVTDEAKGDTLRQWMRSFSKRDVWELLSDENNITIAIREIKVMPDRTLKFKLIDGRVASFPLSKYSPKAGIQNDE